MTRFGIAIAFCALIAGPGASVHAQHLMIRTQASAPPVIVGTWQMGETSGLQSYTFQGNGTYVYAGALAIRSSGGDDIRATKDETGVYEVSGDKLVIARHRGSFSSASGTRALGPETRVYQWTIGNTQLGPALRLVWPSGEAEVFYKR